MIPLSLATSLGLLSLLSADPIVFRHDRTEQASRELAKRFDATAEILPDGSGTLIAPRWVVTAAHVGRGLSPFSPRIRLKGQEHRVRQVLFHPESKGDGRRPPRIDLALLELEKPVVGIDPVALYRESDEVGQAVFVVGYGDFGPAGEQMQRGNGVRRAATNTIDAAEGGRLRLKFDAPPDGTELEGVGGPGDSGGPLFMDTDEGLTLVGVSFASMGGRPGSYGVTDMYVRVSEVAEWLDRAREEAKDAPPRLPDVRDASQGFPAGSRGDLLRAFFEVFNAGEDEGLELFAGDFRSASSRNRSPDGAFVRRMRALVEELGNLTPERVALLEPGKWIVLVSTESAGKRAVHFRFDEEEGAARLADLMLRPE